MATNSGVIINRANDHSAFFNSIKSRNSKSLPELYSSEVNTEACAYSRVEIESSSAVGFSRTMRLALPRYANLNKLYLHSTFSGGTASSAFSATVGIHNVPFIGALLGKEYRLVYQGQVLAKLTPEAIIADLWKHSNDREKKKLQELLGAYNCKAAASSSHNHTANRVSADPEARWISGSAPNDGVCDFYCPLRFWFDASMSPNRLLDLGVLANEVILEVDVESQTNLFIGDSGIATLPSLTNLSAVCYLSEMSDDTLKSYRSLSYTPGGQPLSQIGFDTTHVIAESGVSHTSGTATDVEIKLNQFQGQIFKMYVWAQLNTVFPGASRARVLPVPLDEVSLKATGSSIFTADELSDKEALLESLHNGGDFYGVDQASTSIAASCAVNPMNIMEINFKKPYDFSKISASGSVSFSQLSVPSLKVSISGRRQFGALNTKPATGSYDIHVVAYHTALYSYSTNTSGSTNIRQIMS